MTQLASARTKNALMSAYFALLLVSQSDAVLLAVAPVLPAPVRVVGRLLSQHAPLRAVAAAVFSLMVMLTFVATLLYFAASVCRVPSRSCCHRARDKAGRVKVCNEPACAEVLVHWRDARDSTASQLMTVDGGMPLCAMHMEFMMLHDYTVMPLTHRASIDEDAMSEFE